MAIRWLIPGMVLALVAGGGWQPTATPLLTPPPAAVGGAIDLAQASATIDRLIDADLARQGRQAPPPVDDATWLRRAYLTVIGRIPTYDEAQEFLDDRAPGRRERLIDRLQAGPGRVAHDLIWWCDLLRVSLRLGDRYPGHAYLDWLRTAVAENRPYDRIVRELLTAQGQALAKGNGNTGFYLRDAGMPLDHLSATVQAFLGTRIGCAQCHDHPFDTWTRKQFFTLAAYTANTRIDRDPPKGLRSQLKEQPPEVRVVVRNLANSVFLAVEAPTKDGLALPADYQYPDAKPKQTVTAGPLYGAAPPLAKGSDPRAAFANWMTQGNARFTTTIANRTWKRAFGRGLIEPVDNLTDQSAAENPALLAYLDQVVEAAGYDLVKVQRILLLTQAWQREDAAPAPGTAWRGEAPVTRRLSAEAWWDSLMALAVPDVDLRVGERAEPLYRFYEDHRQDSADAFLDLARDLAGLRGKANDLRRRAQELGDKIRATTDAAELKALRKEQGQLNSEREELLRKAEPARMITKRAKTEGGDRLLRAAELPQPAPPDHPLRVLGQSDRELIDNGSAEPTIPQALWLMNGVVDKELTKGSGPLATMLRARPDDEARISALWWAILTRPPTDAERAAARALLADAKTKDPGKGDLTAGWKDLIWALVNTLEFRVMP